MGTEGKLRILLVDDHTLFIESLKVVIEARTHDMEVVGMAGDGLQAIDLCMKLRPDMVLMDVRMPRLDGVQAAHKIHELYPRIKIIMLTTFDDDSYVRLALTFGASGYLLKNVKPGELIQSIRLVKDSITQLSPEITNKILSLNTPSADEIKLQGMVEKLTQREREVLSLLVAAKENKEITEILGISEQTVKNHVHHLYEKMGVSNRVQLIKIMGGGNGP
jgi:DNA-binding NarL/FixJ family response regulator